MRVRLRINLRHESLEVSIRLLDIFLKLNFDRFHLRAIIIVRLRGIFGISTWIVLLPF